MVSCAETNPECSAGSHSRNYCRFAAPGAWDIPTWETNWHNGTCPAAQAVTACGGTDTHTQTHRHTCETQLISSPIWSGVQKPSQTVY